MSAACICASGREVPHRNCPAHGRSAAQGLHWIVLGGRRIRVSERVQRWWERWGLLIAGSTHTESEYPDRKERHMTDAAQKALDVLVEIAQDINVESDTRIRAAATILGDAKTPAPAREGVPA